ncbi:MgtC/SapB family protein [Pelomonas sp. SE-A7]|uniref:MgtC/SapB family protein n=1 Tax=Pelomonas sp. SE-A7 TaxID=3054953 RepID=UPI00259C9072|nr:MgtC/SapB family protein [Pelomonas sp. SE-A7]MDM4765570.1 MgtC/SapB family protein [Pelomonas sp. SE-A7]
MNLLDLDHLLRYWNATQWAANVLMLMHLLGAMILGLILGYERAYHGRAAGMRTYALVCMASCATIILVGYPDQWFGGHVAGGSVPQFTDPTRVIQGVLTGIGFLCAGVIMREGMNISGLTTAASLWAASAIGIVLGMGFYFAAISLTLLCASLMMWGAKLENQLPSHPAISVMLRGDAGRRFTQEELAAFTNGLGFRFAPGSLSIEKHGEREEWRFVCTAKRNYKGQTLCRFTGHIHELPGVAEYRVTHARN